MLCGPLAYLVKRQLQGLYYQHNEGMLKGGAHKIIQTFINICEIFLPQVLNSHFNWLGMKQRGQKQS